MSSTSTESLGPIGLSAEQVALLEDIESNLHQVNAYNANGWTLLHRAANIHATGYIDRLLQNSASAELKTDDNKQLFPLQIAFESTHFPIPHYYTKGPPIELVAEIQKCLSSLTTINILLEHMTGESIVEVALKSALDGNIHFTACIIIKSMDKIPNALVRPICEAVIGNFQFSHRRSIFSLFKLMKLLAKDIVIDDDLLIFAAKTEDYYAVKFLLKFKVNIDYTDEVKRTALHYSLAQNGNRKIALLLLKNGANVLADADGITPFHLAAAHGFLDILIILHTRDVDLVNRRDSNDETALFYATRGMHLSCICFLIDKNSSWNIKNTSGMSAAQLANSDIIHLQPGYWAAEIKTFTRDAKIAYPAISFFGIPKDVVPSDVLKEALEQHFGGLKMFNTEESHHTSRLYNAFACFFHPEAYHTAIKSKYLKVGPLQLRIRQAYRRQGPNVF